jgi:hypothetical protein
LKHKEGSHSAIPLPKKGKRRKRKNYRNTIIIITTKAGALVASKVPL